MLFIRPWVDRALLLQAIAARSGDSSAWSALSGITPAVVSASSSSVTPSQRSRTGERLWRGVLDHVEKVVTQERNAASEGTLMPSWSDISYIDRVTSSNERPR
jgi:hypothetical protein